MIVGLNIKITTDLVAEDIRQAIYYLGEITGEITNDDLLANPPAAGRYFFEFLYRKVNAPVMMLCEE